MKENYELRESVFKKMGWQKSTVTIPGGLKGEGWFPHDKAKVAIPYLPFIEMDWEVTAKYLVPFMRGKGWYLSYQYKVIPPAIIGGKHQADYKTDYQKPFVMWESEKEVDWAMQPLQHSKWVKSDNIAEAACEAFMEVEI